MGLFGSNYEQAGRGIAKDAPKKKNFFVFWELYFRYSWKLIKLNLLTFIFCIPIVTIGPAIAGMTRVLRNLSMDKNAYVFHDFWKGFTQNWKQALPVGIVDIVFLISALLGLEIYPQMRDAAETGGSIYIVMCVISISFALTIFMMNFYIFPMIVSTNLSLKNIIKNGFYLACLELKKNFITLVIVMAVIALLIAMTFVTLFTLLLVPTWVITFIGFIIVFNSYPKVQKYVINPYYEERGMDNPEFDYLKPLSAEESIFTDMGGKEAPIESKKKKGKIIS